MKEKIPLTLFALALVGQGCSQDAAFTPSAATASTTSLSSAASDTSTTHPIPPRFGLPGPIGKGDIPSGCEYDAATGRFACAEESPQPGMTVTHSYAFFDAGGVSQSAYDEATTASFNIQMTADAAWEVDGNSGSMHKESDLTASGLVGSESQRIWNGTESEVVRGVPPRPDRGPGGPGGPGGHGGGGRGPGGPVENDPPTRVNTAVVVADVIVPNPVTDTSWPLSGTITRTMTREGGSNPGTETSVLTFNGTQYATLTIGDETRTIDLAKGPRGPHPHR